MDDNLDYTIEFINKDFDLESELPEEFNEGNPCYGRDVAGYITSKLKAHNINVDFIDEGWGWQVYGQFDPENKFEFNIYPWGFLNDSTGEEFYLWRLRLCTSKKEKLLGFIPIFKTSKCGAKWREIIQSLFSQDGNQFIRMETNVEWR